MGGNISVLVFDPGDMMPPPPMEGETPEETIANLLDYTRKQSAAFTSLLSQLMNAAQVGFKEMNDGSNTIYANENGVLTLAEAGSSTVTVDQATGTMTFSSSGEENLNGEEMVVEINSAAITLVSTTKTEAKATDPNADQTSANTAANAATYTGASIGVGYTDADITANNAQASAWLTTKIEPGEVRITSGGDIVLLNQMLIDYANDWTDDNASGLYMTTTKMGFFNTATNTWPSVINSDGTFGFIIDANNEVSHDGSQLTLKAEKGIIGFNSDNYFDITAGDINIKHNVDFFRTYNNGNLLDVHIGHPTTNYINILEGSTYDILGFDLLSCTLVSCSISGDQVNSGTMSPLRIAAGTFNNGRYEFTTTTTTGTAPLLIDQNDTDQPMIDLEGTTANDAVTSNFLVNTDDSTMNHSGVVNITGPKNSVWDSYGMMRVSINGTDRWIAVYNYNP